MEQIKLIYYLKQKWTEEKDCYWWFTEIQKKEYGRECPEIDIDRTIQTEALRYMIKKLSSPLELSKNWRKLKEGEKPKDGDGVMMAIKKRPHHIGVALVGGSTINILHCLEGVGMLLSDHIDLISHGWKVKGFLRYEEK